MPDQFATDALFDAVRHGCLRSVRRDLPAYWARLAALVGGGA